MNQVHSLSLTCVKCSRKFPQRIPHQGCDQLVSNLSVHFILHHISFPLRTPHHLVPQKERSGHCYGSRASAAPLKDLTLRPAGKKFREPSIQPMVAR